VLISAEIRSGPESCEGPLAIDWHFAFDSTPSLIEISRFPSSESLEIVFDTRVSEDLVMLTVKDPSNRPLQRIFLLFN